MLYPALEYMPRAARPENHHETRLGQLLREAITAKSAEMKRTGDRRGLSYRELADMAGINHSYVGKLLHGQQQPGRDIVEALIKALYPYLPPDDTLVAAGYLPRTPRWRRIIRHLMHYPVEAVEGIDENLSRVYDRGVARPEDSDEELYEFRPKRRGDS